MHLKCKLALVIARLYILQCKFFKTINSEKKGKKTFYKFIVISVTLCFMHVISCAQFREMEDEICIGCKVSFIASCAEAPGCQSGPAGCGDICTGRQTQKLCGFHFYPSVPLPVSCGPQLCPGWCLQLLDFLLLDKTKL